MELSVSKETSSAQAIQYVSTSADAESVSVETVTKARQNVNAWVVGSLQALIMRFFKTAYEGAQRNLKGQDRQLQDLYVVFITLVLGIRLLGYFPRELSLEDAMTFLFQATWMKDHVLTLAETVGISAISQERLQVESQTPRRPRLCCGAPAQAAARSW